MSADGSGGGETTRRRFLDEGSDDINYHRLILDTKNKIDVLSARFDSHEKSTLNAITKMDEKSDDRHEYMKGEIRGIKEDAKQSIAKIFDEFKKYVSAERYKPVELLVYGMSGTVLLAVFAALVALVVNKTGGG